MSERPLRVLEVVEASVGGVKRHLLDLLAGLREHHDVEAEVVCPRVRDENYGDDSFSDEALALGYTLHPVRMRRRVDPLGDAAATMRLAGVIRNGGYDVVHLHSSKAGAVGRAAVRLAFPRRDGRPAVVYTPHGFSFLIPARPRVQRLYAEVERTLGRVTDRLIAISGDERSEALARRIAPASKIRIVRSGIDLAALPDGNAAAAKRAAMGWGEQTILGTVSAMRPQKDPFTLLRAAAGVLRERDDLRFVWIMGGELERAVLAEADRLPAPVRERIDFLGYRSDAIELVAAMDVFAISSVFEAGLPYVLMEAFGLGRAVAATAGVGTRELLEDGVNALVAPVSDDAVLATRMLRLVRDAEERERLGRAARELVVECCTVERQVRETVDVYRDAVSARRRAP